MSSKALSTMVVAGAAALSALTPMRAQAQNGGAFVGGLIGGLIGGAIAAQSRPAYGYAPQRRAVRVVRERPAPRARVVKAVAGVGAGAALVGLPLAAKQVAVIDASADPFAPMSGGSAGLVSVSDKR